MRLLLWATLILGSQSLTAQTQVATIDAQQDLKQMVQWVKEVHYHPFLTADSADFEIKLQQEIQELALTDSITAELFTLKAMRLLAFLNDGHTSINLVSRPLVPGLLAHTFWNVPITFHANKSIEILSGKDMGKTIQSINGVQAQELYRQTMACYGGNENFRREISQAIYFPIFLHLKGMHPPYTIQFSDDSRTILETGVGINELLKMMGAIKDPYAFKVLDGTYGYLAYNKCEDGAAFKTFLSQTFKELEEKKIAHLIIDIRANTGGNSALNAQLLAYVTKKAYRQSSGRFWKVSPTFKEEIQGEEYTKMWNKSFIKQYVAAPDYSILKEDEYGLVSPKKAKPFFEGEVVLLIGPQTFSSANFLADAVATYKLMPIIGQPTGENTNDFGEQIMLVLPHSKLELQVSVAYDIGADGNQNRITPVQPTIYTEEDALKVALEYFQRR